MLYGVQASAKLFLFWAEANKPEGGRCDVALEANFEGKRSEEGCYGVGSRWGLVAGRRRIRFN